MKAIHRLFEYIGKKGIKPTRLEKEIGLSNGYLGTQLKRGADLGEGVLKKIIDYCLDISPEWLLTGRGSMSRDELPVSVPETIEIHERDPRDIQLIATQEDLIKALKRQVRDLEGRGFRTENLHGVQPADIPIISPETKPRHK